MFGVNLIVNVQHWFSQVAFRCHLLHSSLHSVELLVNLFNHHVECSVELHCHFIGHKSAFREAKLSVYISGEMLLDVRNTR